MILIYSFSLNIYTYTGIEMNLKLYTQIFNLRHIFITIRSHIYIGKLTKLFSSSGRRTHLREIDICLIGIEQRESFETRKIQTSMDNNLNRTDHRSF